MSKRYMPPLITVCGVLALAILSGSGSAEPVFTRDSAGLSIIGQTGHVSVIVRNVNTMLDVRETGWAGSPSFDLTIEDKASGTFQSFSDLDLDGQADIKTISDLKTNKSMVQVFTAGHWEVAKRIIKGEKKAELLTGETLTFVGGHGWQKMTK